MNDQVAVIFYRDHDPGAFVEFQRNYLDNVFVKFLYAKGFLKEYDEWKRDGNVAHETVGEVLTFDCWDADRSEGPWDETMSAEARTAYERLGLKGPVEESFNAETLQAYLWTVEAAIATFCNASGDAARRLSATDEDPEPRWTHDAGLGLFVHPRFGGTILVRRKVNGRPVIFGYAPSIKFELPCCADECLFGTKTWKWREETKPIMAQHRCLRIAVLDRPLNFPEEGEIATRKRKRKAPRQVMKGGNEVHWLETGSDLEDFLERKVPADLRAALGK